MNWYLKVLRQYVDFDGRARRKEYWMYTLFNMIFLIVAAVLDNITGMNFEPAPYGVLYMVYALAVFLPGLAVSIRRLHDQGKSGWWVLIGIIPFVGAIWLLVLFCTNGNSGSNEYGADPKGDSTKEINEIGVSVE